MTAAKTQSFQDAMKAAESEPISEVDLGELVQRADGYYWQAADGTQEIGPYATMEAALADVAGADADDDAEPGESLEEAEDEIGIADWIDPDTGEPAEGLSTPRLHDE